MNNLLIVGAGGLGSEALWVAREMGTWDFSGYADDDASKGMSIDAALAMEPHWFHCSIGDNTARKSIFGRFADGGWKPATLIHPSVLAGPDTHVGEGSYVGAGSILCPHSSAGKGVVINCHVTIGHHSRLGDFSQMCPGSRINGNCTVGELAFVGSNASLRPGVSLGTSARVGSNSFVVNDVKDNRLVIGVPARYQ